jgi:WD40 repeat protein
MKLLVILMVLIVCLILSLEPVAAQEPLPPIPANRLPITPENAKNLELLATWQTGAVASVSWVENQRLAVQDPVQTLIYHVNNLSEADAIIPATGQSPLLSPDGNWLIFEDDFVLYYGGGRSAIVWNTRTGASRSIRFSPSYGQASLEAPHIVMWVPPAQLIIARGSEFFVIDPDQADEIAVTARIHPPSEQTNYEIVQLVAAPDGSQVFTLARAFISDQLVLLAWDLDTVEPRVLFQSEFLWEEYPNQYINPYQNSPVLQLNQDASEIALLTIIPAEQPSSLAHKYEYRLRRWELKSGRELPSYDIGGGNWITGWAYAWDAYFEREGDNCNLRSLADQAQVVQLRPWYDGSSRCVIWQLTPGAALFSDRKEDIFYLYRLADNTQTPFTMPNDVVTPIISPDGRYMASRDEEGRLYLWQTDNLDAPVIQDYRTLYRGGRDMALSPDGHKLIVVGPDGAQQFDLRTGERRIVVEETGIDFLLVAYHPNGESFVIADRRGAIRSYDARDFTLQFILWDAAWPQDFGFSENGQLLAVVSQYTVTIWQMDSLTAINQLTKTGAQSRYGDEVVFLENGQWLVYNAQLWQIEEQGRLIAALTWDDDDDLPQPVWTYLRSASVIAADSAYRFFLTYGHENGVRLRLKDVPTGAVIWFSDFELAGGALSADLIALGGGHVIYFWGVLPGDGES